MKHVRKLRKQLDKLDVLLLHYQDTIDMMIYNNHDESCDYYASKLEMSREKADAQMAKVFVKLANWEW